MSFKKKPYEVPRDPVLQELIEAHGVQHLARMVDPVLTKQAVYAWPHVPERWVAKVAKATGRTRHQLRPDLFTRTGHRINGDKAKAAKGKRKTK
jgi:hypothetical protein